MSKIGRFLLVVVGGLALGGGLVAAPAFLINSRQQVKDEANQSLANYENALDSQEFKQMLETEDQKFEVLNYVKTKFVVMSRVLGRGQEVSQEMKQEVMTKLGIDQWNWTLIKDKLETLINEMVSAFMPYYKLASKTAQYLDLKRLEATDNLKAYRNVLEGKFADLGIKLSDKLNPETDSYDLVNTDEILYNKYEKVLQPAFK
ncbi:hypothetical protein H9M94_01395 [Mycoplasma sp. Pen4]|uniref:hypothetical protein n=1 Tax=Mycoplasma sp. Pen4 TaxID=640330 RepID=UPI001654050D|nr:hypothetical protein [Mycoplasma sp. Pen4]QNM93911.1 hypothetical protein H9M94_01395 [Mycoplasma sp. Pen4]